MTEGEDSVLPEAREGGEMIDIGILRNLSGGRVEMRGVDEVEERTKWEQGVGVLKNSHLAT